MKSKKKGMLSIVMVLVLVLVTACGGEKKEVSLGITESGSYTNDYFGFSLTFPKEWVYQNADQMRELMAASAGAIAGDDKAKGKMMDLSVAKTLNLLMASKFPLDSGKAGPSAVAVAEKVSMLQGIKSGKDYLEASKKLMTDSQLPYKYKEITTVKVGGKDMDMMEATIEAGDLNVSQDYYSTIIDGYAFNLILTYTDDESKVETDKILQSVKFK